jgi:quinol monooxygenase YgiN
MVMEKPGERFTADIDMSDHKESAVERKEMKEGFTDEICVLVFLNAKPEFCDEFLQLLSPVLDAMRHEPTFISAVLHRSPEDPNNFMLYEVWADRDDLVNVQMKREYRAAYEARLPDLLREPRRAVTWERLRGDFSFFAKP